MKRLPILIALILLALGAILKTPAPAVSLARSSDGWHDLGTYAGEIGDVDTKKGKS